MFTNGLNSIELPAPPVQGGVQSEGNSKSLILNPSDQSDIENKDVNRVRYLNADNPYRNLTALLQAAHEYLNSIKKMADYF